MLFLKASQIDEMEGGSFFGYDHKMHSGSHVLETVFDETSSCAPAFQVLKQLIQRCITDAVASENVFADAIQKHLCRWFCRLRSLSIRDHFEWIELEPFNFWHSLLFMDQYNYGGIQAKIVAGSAAGIIEDESQVQIISSWNVAECLPKETQVAAKDGSICTPSITVMAAESLEASVTEYLKYQVSSYFTQELIRIVEDTLHHFKEKKKMDEGDSANHGLPRPFDSNPHKGDAALEFIKHVCCSCS